MSRGFKLTLATIALILGVWTTFAAGFGCALGGSHSFSCLLGTTSGPLTFVFYIIFFITNLDLFFYLTLLPFLYIILGSLGFLG